MPTNLPERKERDRHHDMVIALILVVMFMAIGFALGYLTHIAVLEIR